MRRLFTVTCAFFMLAAAPAAASAQGLFELFMSPEQERQIGAQEHPKVLAQFGGAYDDPELAAYIDSIGQFLARTSEAPSTPFIFTVLNSPVVNAMALPGGYVYVTRGLLALADNEAEVAGVIAHEIGHVAAHHGRDRHGKSVLANLGLVLLGAVTDSAALVNVAQFGALAVLRSYSREDELEADMLGVRYLSRAGFAPQAMSSFLRKLEAHHELEALLQGSGRGGGFDFLSTHPRTGDRVARAIEAAGAASVRDPIVARDIYLDKIDGMIFGDDPAQGVVQGRRFVHPVLGFEFTVPEGFRLLNGQRQVIARGPEGVAIQFDADSRPVGLDMRRYVRERWAREAQLAVLERVSINGMEAATAVVEGQRADVRLLAIGFDADTVYRFMFLSRPERTRAFDPLFRQTALSFRRLSATEARSIRPLRIAVRTVEAGESVESLAERMPFPDRRLERFRVLNGLREGEALRAGEKVKMVIGDW